MARWDSTKLERFEARIERVPFSGCWVWMGYAKPPWGYGVTALNNASIFAHRLAWILFVGEIPEGLLVCHHCDVPCCVNPKHLFLGTNDDNMKDMARKGRSRRPTGEINPRCRLTESQALEILRLSATGETIASLSRMFGVNSGTIHHLVKRKNWKHLVIAENSLLTEAIG